MLKTAVLLTIFVETKKLFQTTFDELSSKELVIYLKPKSTITNVFTFTFDQFNASLLNQTICFFKNMYMCHCLQTFERYWYTQYIERSGKYYTNLHSTSQTTLLSVAALSCETLGRFTASSGSSVIPPKQDPINGT